ncbi:MAG: M20 family metallopeptidase [Cyclobacteriaceae bacterium]|nr:M20 family metallopeptidase [Cyclobacteriaceae bacterium]
MNRLEKIKFLSAQHARQVIAMRRHLHAHPELSYQETGVVATIKGKNPDSKLIALRADMDALPIQEINDVPYRSINAGVMHACGHDAHTASLLGTAFILHELKDEFEGTVRLIFQPGEEKNPGGASFMIDAGVLQNPVPSSIVGQHVFPLLPVGKVGFREGMYMASSDEIYLRVIGKGGHGAAPDLTIDPVVIASHLIIALQQIISRNASPKQPTVLTFGKITADGATNIIPDEVKIAGTFRAMNEEWRREGLARITKMAKQIAEGMGGRCEVEISNGYPYLQNDPAVTKRIREAAEAYVGKENVIELDLSLGSEDFAYYSQVIPASFYRLGTRNEEKGITAYLHTPAFDIDEDALEIGPGLMAWIAIHELESLPVQHS